MLELQEYIEPVNQDKQWAPFKKQQEFIQLPHSIFEGLYGGAAGGGKSEMLVLLPLIYQFHLEPRFKGIILRRKYPELESEIIIRSHEYYNAAGGKYNSQKRRWQFPSGAYIFFGHAEYTNDIRNYDGAEYQYVAFDELTHFEEFQYLYLIGSRVRTSSNLPTIIRSATNPGNIGHAWVRKRFVEPYPLGGKILRDKKTAKTRFFLQAKATDNPHIDKDYVNKLELLPEAEKRSKLYGDWWSFSGQVFIDFRTEPLNDEPSNACHVVESRDIPSWWPKIIAGDWGSSAMTIWNFYAVSPDSRVYQYDEYAVNGGEEKFPHLDQNVKVTTWAIEVGRRIKGHNLVDCVLDWNAFDNTNEDQSVAQQFQELTKITPRKADKGPGSRKSGRTIVEEYLRWRPRPRLFIPTGLPDSEKADFILRHHGIKEYHKYYAQFSPEPEEKNLPKLQIFSHCRETIHCIPLCIWDENNIEDVKEFHGDDPYDVTRYGLKAVRKYFETAREEHERLQRVDKAEQIRTTNPHNYYMMMRKIEADTKKNFGVSMSRRRW